MNITRYRFSPDYANGAFANTVVDSVVHVSPYQHVAITPQITITTTYTDPGNLCFAGTMTGVTAQSLSASNQWALVSTTMVTPNAGDTVSFTTAAQQVTIYLTGLTAADGSFHSGDSGLTANRIRNGALAQFLVDGVLVATLNCYQAAPSFTYDSDGASHVYTVVHSGRYDTLLTPVSTPAAVVGTSLSAANVALPVTNTAANSLINAAWRLLATATGGGGTGAYSLYQTLPGASETLIASGLLVGTTYQTATRIPGVALTVSGTITSGDDCTFTTDQVQIAITSVVLGVGTGGNYGAYTSPVIDSGAPDTSWFNAEWTQGDWVQGMVNGVGGYVSGAFSFQVGQTPNPDASWTSLTQTPGNTQLPSGAGFGTSALVREPRGRYGQWTLTLPKGLTTLPWFGDVLIFYWVPERDPHVLGKIVLGANRVPGPILQAVLGVSAQELALLHQMATDLVAGYAISGATDAVLAQYGVDYGLGQYSGEPQQSFVARLINASGARAAGGSASYIAAQIAFLVFGQTPNPATTSLDSTGRQTVSRTSLALSTGPVIVTQISGMLFSVTVPPPASTSAGTHYPGLPGLSLGVAQAVISAAVATLTPVGAALYNTVTSTAGTVIFQ